MLSLLDERASLSARLQNSPYNVDIYLRRAYCHEKLGFPDLAVGDAYRALLLTDEILDDSGEYHDEANEAIGEISQDRFENEDADSKPANDLMNGDAAIVDMWKKSQRDSQADGNHESLAENLARYYARKALLVLSRALIRCGCLRSAFDFSLRGLKLFPDDLELQQQQDQIVDTHLQNLSKKNLAWDSSAFNPRTDLPEHGSVRREVYVWNKHEPDRFSEPSLSFLNSEMRKVAPKCEVRAVSLPLLSESTSSKPAEAMPHSIQQLGVFAIEDIAPHEIFLHESSILTANIRLYDPLCDACSSPLPPVSPSLPSLPSCPYCDDTVFCSEACHTAAQECYHPAVCGKADFDIVAKHPSPSAATNALYLLLLARAMALSETQEIHPLDLPETKYIWGDFIASDPTYTHSASNLTTATARHLPFTFHDNILAPLHLLEKMDINIFTQLPRCDTWVFNTLYAKFRATASARFSTHDGQPDVCAVHPMWCLANHSCAPNVRWEWGGEISFQARGETEAKAWKDIPGRDCGRGIKNGEEVLSHYCDVELGLAERREWAVGALGGICVCERCVWEEGGGNGEAGGGEKTG